MFSNACLQTKVWVDGSHRKWDLACGAFKDKANKLVAVKKRAAGIGKLFIF